MRPIDDTNTQPKSSFLSKIITFTIIIVLIAVTTFILFILFWLFGDSAVNIFT